MMHALKIRKIGGSLGVILPKKILEDLHADEGDEVLAVKEDNGIIRLVKQDVEFETQMKAFAKGVKRYKNALKELSKR